MLHYTFYIISPLIPGYLISPPNGVRMANDSNEKLGIISVEVIF